MPEGWGPVDPVSFAAFAAALMSAGLAAASWRPGLVVRFPRTVLVLLTLPTLAAGAALVRLDPPGVRLAIDPSTEPLLPVGDPAIDVYRKAVLDFGDDQVFVVAMECDEVFSHENLSALRRVSDAISRIEGVRSVKSLVRVTSFRYVPELEWIEIRPLIEEVPSDPAALADLRRRALGDPVYRRNLVSEDGRTAALNVSFRDMTDRDFIEADIDGRIAAVLAGETGATRRFHVSGRPHIKTRMYHTMTRDLLVLIPLAIAVVTAVLALVSGTLRGVVLPIGTVTAAALWTFGAIALLGLPLTILTVLLAPSLVAIGSVYGVHVVNRYEEEDFAAGGASAALECLRHMIVPVWIAGLTTMVGYGALLWTDVPAVFEIGAFSVLGIASITLISLTGIPAALALLPPPSGKRFRAAVRLSALLDDGLASLSGFVRRHTGPVISAWALLAALAAAAVPFIDVDTDYLSFFDEDAPVRRDFDAINRLLSGAVPLYVILEGEPEALRDPERLRGIEALQARIDGLEGVSRTLSFLDSMRAMNRAVEGGDPSEERIPDTRSGVTELFFMYPKAELTRFATVDQSAANLIVRTGAVGSREMRALAERIESVLADGVPEGLSASVTGNALLLMRAADGVARSQPRTVGLAALTIFALLAIGFRSLKLGLVAMIPNVVPVAIFFGVLGAGVAPLSLPTSLIGSVALGIAIDATAHFIVRYRGERARGATPERAAEITGVAVGRPVSLAALMLTLGFGSVCFSEFATLRQFGLLSAFTMAVCAATDLLLLPALLIRWRL